MCLVLNLDSTWIQHRTWGTKQLLQWMEHKRRSRGEQMSRKKALFNHWHGWKMVGEVGQYVEDEAEGLSKTRK